MFNQARMAATCSCCFDQPEARSPGLCCWIRTAQKPFPTPSLPSKLWDVSSFAPLVRICTNFIGHTKQNGSPTCLWPLGPSSHGASLYQLTSYPFTPHATCDHQSVHHICCHLSGFKYRNWQPGDANPAAALTQLTCTNQDNPRTIPTWCTNLEQA